MATVGRNEPCPCGSGKKYKLCCANKQQNTPVRALLIRAVIGLMLMGGLVVALTSLDDFSSDQAGPRRVWSEEHGHWH